MKREKEKNKGMQTMKKKKAKKFENKLKDHLLSDIKDYRKERKHLKKEEEEDKELMKKIPKKRKK